MMFKRLVPKLPSLASPSSQFSFSGLRWGPGICIFMSPRYSLNFWYNMDAKPWPLLWLPHSILLRQMSAALTGPSSWLQATDTQGSSLPQLSRKLPEWITPTSPMIWGPYTWQGMLDRKLDMSNERRPGWKGCKSPLNSIPDTHRRAHRYPTK